MKEPVEVEALEDSARLVGLALENSPGFIPLFWGWICGVFFLITLWEKFFSSNQLVFSNTKK